MERLKKAARASFCVFDVSVSFFQYLARIQFQMS